MRWPLWARTWQHREGKTPFQQELWQNQDQEGGQGEWRKTGHRHTVEESRWRGCFIHILDICVIFKCVINNINDQETCHRSCHRQIKMRSTSTTSPCSARTLVRQMFICTCVLLLWSTIGVTLHDSQSGSLPGVYAAPGFLKHAAFPQTAAVETLTGSNRVAFQGKWGL